MDTITSAQPAAQTLALAGTHTSERLSHSSFDLQVDLTDNRGRAVRLSIAGEQLDYNRTYNRYGVVAGPTGQGQGQGLMEQLRRYVGDQMAEQAGQRLGIVAEHEEVSVSARSLEINVEGDLSLLEDYFSAPKTAQRIVDFGLGLLGGQDRNSTAFQEAFGEVRRGIAEGFAMAEHMLGGLAEISMQTREVVDTMLDAVTADPTAPVPRAIDVYQQLFAQEEMDQEEA